MAVSRKWAGRIFGTNTGNIFVSLDGETEAQLEGKLRVNDEGVGVAVYSIKAAVEGSTITIEGEPDDVPEGTQGGKISATGTMSSNGTVKGDWQSSIGTGGTFTLYPHHQVGDNQAVVPAVGGAPEQLHTARHNFGAIEITRPELERLAEKLEADMKGEVIVTVVAGTEQARYLPAFKAAVLPMARADAAKVHCRVETPTGLANIVQIEFGPSVNYISAQSADESWALGTVEKYKRELLGNGRFYATRIRRWGLGINDLIIAWAIIILPDLPNLMWRVGAFVGAMVVSRVIGSFHDRYVPFATIWIGPRSDNPLAKISPSLWSGIITIASGLAVAIASAYALNMLGLNPPPVATP